MDSQIEPVTNTIQWQITLPKRVFRLKFLDFLLILAGLTLLLASLINGGGQLIYYIVGLLSIVLFFFLCFFTLKKPEANFEVYPQGAKRVLIKPYTLTDYLPRKGLLGSTFNPTNEHVTKIEWSNVRRVVPDAEQHTVTLYKLYFRLLTLKYLTLYCLPENYEAVLRIAQGGIPQSATMREK